MCFHCSAFRWHPNFQSVIITQPSMIDFLCFISDLSLSSPTYFDSIIENALPWVMGHMGHGSWVKYSVGHMGHGSLEVIHRLLWSRSKQMRFQRPAKLSKRQVELAKRKLFHKRGPATANTRSRRRVQVRWITHVTASDDRRQQ